MSVGQQSIARGNGKTEKGNGKAGDATSIAGESRGLLAEHVYTVVADDIEGGALLPGDRLPPERVLCERLGVSRATVRRALAALAADGLVESHVGRGTFVARTVLGEPPNTLMSFTELGRARRLVATSTVLASVVAPATLDEADEFGLAPGADIFHLRRVRMLDGHPIAIDSARVPLEYAPTLASIDFSAASLYETLDASGCAPIRADYVVEATKSGADVSALLGVEVGDALLVAHTHGYDESGRLVEMTTMTYRGDRYRFRAGLRRRRKGWRIPQTNREGD